MKKIILTIVILTVAFSNVVLAQQNSLAQDIENTVRQSIQNIPTIETPNFDNAIHTNDLVHVVALGLDENKMANLVNEVSVQHQQIENDIQTQTLFNAVALGLEANTTANIVNTVLVNQQMETLDNFQIEIEDTIAKVIYQYL